MNSSEDEIKRGWQLWKWTANFFKGKNNRKRRVPCTIKIWNLFSVSRNKRSTARSDQWKGDSVGIRWKDTFKSRWFKGKNDGYSGTTHLNILSITGYEEAVPVVEPIWRAVANIENKFMMKW